LEENNELKDKIQEKMKEIVKRHIDSAERHVEFIRELIIN
jgi:hypothetical protein